MSSSALHLDVFGDGGEGAEEALEVGDDGNDLGLLEHHLADPDAVGVAVASPGQVALVLGEPLPLAFSMMTT